MPLRLALHILVVLLPCAPGANPQEAFPAPVFVTSLETPALPRMKPEEYEAAIARTRNAMFAVAEELRRQHGDKTSAWPPDVWAVFHDAEDAHMLTIARRDYQPPETRLGLASSVEDFLRGAAGNKGMTVVKSEDEAAIVVQITGRRFASAPGPTDNRYFVRFRLRPGNRITRERFLELTRDYKWNDLRSKQFAHAKDTSGFVDLEAGSMASYKNCAGMVRVIVERFIRASMDPAARKPPVQ